LQSLNHELSYLVNNSDPYYISSKKHYFDLISRFGDQIFCFNLVKNVEAVPRETILAKEYAAAIDCVIKDFEDEPAYIKYHHYDMKNSLKQ
jgi:hypothetical protein